MADSAAITAVVAAEELLELGQVAIEEADYISDWQQASFDLTTQTVGVFAEGETDLVAFAQVHGDRGDAAVHPDHRRRGLGTALAGWMRQCAAAHGATQVGSPCPQGSAADVLLEKLGYRVRWTSWVLELLDGASVPARVLPDGYAVRTAEVDDYRAVWTVVEDAFLEWSVRERTSFEDYAARTVRRPGFEPWNLRVVTDPEGAVVATALCHLNTDGPQAGAYIDQLATQRDHRGLGLAQALLVDAFAVAREHGAERFELSTDSRTGALGLYEKVGMSVTSTWVNRAIDVGVKD
jgi:mycothiol synthase